MPWLELGLSTIILIAGALSLVVMSRTLQPLRAMKADPPRDWDALEPERKKSIRRSLWRGEAVEDPHEAEIALDLVLRQERVHRLLLPLAWIYTPLLAVFLAVGLLAADWWFLAWFGGAGLAFNVVLSPLTWYQRRQMRKAVGATPLRM